MMKKLSIAYCAGAFGGLINSLAIWVFGSCGITLFLGVKIAPKMSQAWLYPRLVWGGIWGILFVLPFMENSFFLRAIIYSLAPTLVQLFVVFPLNAQGIAGMDLGALTPVFVLFFNLVWGLSAAAWLKMSAGRS